ncbi:MAG: hypothetical protein IH616_09835 [Gemmatimonadales bacterium]|nr:hypothetical protein [Gemmatimonadales bacterium]
MICLVHEPVGLVPPGSRVDAVVGCDRQFGNGVIAPIDDTPDDAPGFAEFVQRITDGPDDRIVSSVDLASPRCWQGRCGAGGFGNWASLIFMGEPQTLTDLPPRRVDLRGRTLSLIRLSGRVELTPLPDGNAWAYDLVWEFYGT